MRQITGILKEETVVTGLQTADKEGALNHLIELIEINSSQKDAVREAVFERENIISTGIGKGVAIPHCKVSNIDKNYGSLAILAEPISFESIDDVPVQILFLLVSPAVDDGQHLRLMGLISRILIDKNFRDKLLKLESNQAVLKAFQQAETKYK